MNRKVVWVIAILAVGFGIWFFFFRGPKEIDPSQQVHAYKKGTATPSPTEALVVVVPNTNTPTATVTVEATKPPTEAIEPSITEVVTNSPSPTENVEISPSVSPTEEITPEVTNTPTIEVTNTPTVVATNTPTKVPTKAPTKAPTVTKTPTKKPTATNTPKPTATNTPKPVATNTPKPTATPKPNVPVSDVGKTYYPTDELGKAINDYRVSIGASKLQTSDMLQKIAKQRLAELHETGLSHYRPDGSKGLSIFESYEIERLYGGELFHSAYDLTATDALYGWTHGTANKAILSDNKYTLVAYAMDSEYAVAMFITLMPK